MEKIIQYIDHNFKQILDLIIFTGIWFLGVVAKTFFEYKKGIKITILWFVAEAILSLFVYLLVYYFFDQFLQLNKMLNYIISSWCGSYSQLFRSRIEILLEIAWTKLTLYVEKW